MTTGTARQMPSVAQSDGTHDVYDLGMALVMAMVLRPRAAQSARLVMDPRASGVEFRSRQ
jgi:hypothetical protein